MSILLLKNNEYHKKKQKKPKKYQKIPKKIPKIEKKKENEYHKSYVNVCKLLKTSTKVEVCEYYELWYWGQDWGLINVM